MVKAKKSFWSRVFRLSEDTAEDEGQSSNPRWHTVEQGSTGTASMAGYPDEEYLQKLRGTERADKFDEMRRSDAQVAMCLAAVKNPIKAASWTVEPPEDATDEEKLDAELVSHLLFNDLEPGWKRFLDEALTFIDFGHSVFEITHRVALANPRFGSYNAFRLGFRSQRTIERWNLCSKTGKLTSITQYAYGDLDRHVDIPARFLLALSLNQEGSNYEGISALRPCYGPWVRKNLYLKLNAIGIEKFAIPTPIAETPPNKETGPEYDALVEALDSFTGHEKGYIIHPAGFKIVVTPNQYDPEKVEYSIDNEDKRMAKAFLANFLELGTGGSGGAYALSNDLSDFFLSGIEHVAAEICDVMNRRLLPEMVMMNRGPRARYPQLKASGISDKAGKELGELLKYFVDSRVLTPDTRLETSIRKRAGLPAADPTTARQPPPPPQPFGGGGTLSERMRRRGY